MKNSNSNDWLIALLAAFAIYLPLLLRSRREPSLLFSWMAILA